MEFSDKLDLRLGNPSFMEEYWKTVSLPTTTNLPMSYTVSRNHDDLKASILKLHYQVGNIKTDNKHIIIGNGATQIITALIHCMGNKVYFESPHYYKFSDFCRLTKIKRATFPFGKYTYLKTIPNNPDNEVDIFEPSNNTIYDMCYYWPTYTHVHAQDSSIAVFSSAKALGNCSSRIGWAFIQDKELATKVEEYIETNVGGISIEAKMKTMMLINHVLQNKDFFQKMNLTLRDRWNKLNLIIPENFDVINTFGLYAWCLGKCPDNIVGLKGSLFGVSDNYFRFNIGCSTDDFNKLLEILNGR